MYYFASDMHFGSPYGRSPSVEREREVCRWLDAVSADARAIYLVGDIFDFWFEYKAVVPKGFTRFLGKLSELSDRGVEVHLFMGNHDMWMCGYLESECGLKLHRGGETLELYGRKVYVSHGDKIMDGARLSDRLRGACLRSSTLRWLFSRLVHPSLALRFGHWWSNHSRTTKALHVFRGEDEPLVKFARGMLAAERTDYFVFGHIHCAEDFPLAGTPARVVFTGDWITGEDYAVLSPDGKMELKSFL